MWKMPYQNAPPICASVLFRGAVPHNMRFAVQLVASVSAVSFGVATPTFRNTFAVATSVNNRNNTL